MIAVLPLLLLAVTDLEAPIIEDVAAAASNPGAAPVITVMMSDRGSGVGTAAVFYRPSGGGAPSWQKAELKGGTSGMFIARLPDGLQTTGFQYYVEATDISGNGPARIASPEQPIEVPKAEEPTMARLERAKQDEALEATPAIHPGWVMLSLGVGVLSAAGTGAYALDLVQTQQRIENVDESLARTDLTAQQRAQLEGSRANFEDAVLQDTIISSVLGVIAAAGLVTGTVLLVASAVE